MAKTKRATSRGFTLVELLLAMAGVAVLLISIAVTTIQLTNMYHKGITIKSINQSGREVGDLIRRDGLTIGQGEVRFVAADTQGAGGLGRLCIGSRSYIWNKPENLRSNDPSAAVRYNSTGDAIILARVADPLGTFCISQNGVYATDVSTTGTMRATELLKGQADLAVYQMSVTPIFDRDGDRAFNISYTLGTNQGEEINTTDQTCRTSNEAENNFTFCAINQFNEIVIMEKAS